MGVQSGFYQYRILLSVSLALLGHALIAVGFLMVDVIPEPPKTVRFELVNPGQGPQTSAPAPNVDPLAATAPENPSPSQTPDVHAAIEEQIRAITETPAPRMAPEPQKRQQASEQSSDIAEGLRTPVANPRPKLPVSPFAQAPSPESRASENSMAGVPTPFKAPEDPDEHVQTTTKEAEQVNSYQLRLAHKMMRTLRTDILKGATGERYAAELHGEPIPLSLELKLMSNGALQRVRVTQSSGNEFVDRIMVQTALAASPYPEPPEEERLNGFLFNLRLVASPRIL